MSCEQIRPKLPEYTVGLLEGQERLDIERHLQECPPCFGELQALNRTGILLDSVALEEAPDSLWESVRSRIAVETPPARRNLRDIFFRGFPRLAYAGLVATAVLAIILVLTFSRPMVRVKDDEAGNFIERHGMLAWNDPLSDKAALGAMVGASVAHSEIR